MVWRGKWGVRGPQRALIWASLHNIAQAGTAPPHTPTHTHKTPHLILQEENQHKRSATPQRLLTWAFLFSDCLQFKSASDTGLLAKGERLTLRNVPGEVNNCVGGLLWFFGIFRWKVGSFYPWGSIMASSWLEFFYLVQLEKAVQNEAGEGARAAWFLLINESS